MQAVPWLDHDPPVDADHSFVFGRRSSWSGLLGGFVRVSPPLSIITITTMQTLAIIFGLRLHMRGFLGCR